MTPPAVPVSSDVSLPLVLSSLSLLVAVRLLSPVGSCGVLLLYGISVTAPVAPRAVLALTHAHGRCIAMAWYPHALETFDDDQPTDAARDDQRERLGVIAAIFTDGTVQVRVVPKIPDTNQQDTIHHIRSRDHTRHAHTTRMGVRKRVRLDEVRGLMGCILLGCPSSFVASRPFPV
jgi:hypothetical protein